jgi:CHAT domain-containing protein
MAASDRLRLPPEIEAALAEFRTLESQRLGSATGARAFANARARLLSMLPAEKYPIVRADVLSSAGTSDLAEVATPEALLGNFDEALGLVWPQAGYVAAKALVNGGSAILQLPEQQRNELLGQAASRVQIGSTLLRLLHKYQAAAGASLLLARIVTYGRGTDLVTRTRTALDIYGQGLGLFPETLAPAAAPLEYGLLQRGYAKSLLALPTADRLPAARQAVARLREALAYLTPAVSLSDHIRTRSMLSEAYFELYQRENASAHLRAAHEEAAAALATLVEATPLERDTELRAMLENNLGAIELHLSEEDRAFATSAIEHLDRALTTARPSVDTAETKYNLALAHLKLTTGTDWHWATARQLLDESFRSAVAEDAVHARRTAVALAEAYLRCGDYVQAANQFNVVLDAASTEFDASVVRDARRAELAAQGGLFERAAYVLARAGDLPGAVQALEAGRYRTSPDAFAAARADEALVAQTNLPLWEKYVAVRERVRELESRERSTVIAGRAEGATSAIDASLVEEVRQARSALAAVLAEIRTFPNLRGYLRTPSTEQIQATLNEGTRTAMVYTAVTAEEAIAIVVQKDRLEAVKLRVTLAELHENVRRYASSYSDSARAPDDPAAMGHWQAAIDELGAWLWRSVMGPILLRLGGVEHAVLLPGGELSLIPLHIAWESDPTRPTGRRYALDVVPLSYATTARMRMRRPQAVEPNQGTPLVVADPRPCSGRPLLYAEDEGEVFAAVFSQARRLGGAEARLAAVRSAIKEANVVHFACHGSYNFQEPLATGLLLACDEVLTLAELQGLGAPVSTRLAVLSACETAVLDPFAPGEPFSLAAAMVELGTRAVLGSVWQVPDLPTLLLMIRFYEVWTTQSLRPAEALCNAQVWLRDTTNDEKARYFGESADPIKVPRKVARRLYAKLVVAPRDGRDFAHPHNWAGFQLYGE